MKTMKQLLLILIPSLVMIPAQSPAQSRFDQWDKDKDGKLSREELPDQARRNFDRVDKDGDGAISREEDAAVTNRNRTREQPRRPDNQGGLPGTIEVVKDIPYAGTDNPRQTLDLFLPGNRGDDPLPLLVFIHGGGWQNGSKDGGGRRIAPFLADGRYAGASIGYRLTDEASWPSQIHDCKAAIRWLRGNAKKYNLDPEKIAVWGTSAGGHLVAMLGVSDKVDGLAGDLGDFDDEESRVTCVIDYFGPTELHKMNDYEKYPSTMDHNAPDSPESKLVGGAILENIETSKNASPVTHVSADDAAFLIVHGTKDPLVPWPQSVELDKLLDKAGVESVLIKVEDGGHGKGFPNEALQSLIGKFLEKHLRGKDVAIEETTLPAESDRTE